MNILLIVLFLLIFFGFSCGAHFGGTPYGYGSFGLGGIFLVVFIVLLVMRRL